MKKIQKKVTSGTKIERKGEKNKEKLDQMSEVRNDKNPHNVLYAASSRIA